MIPLIVCRTGSPEALALAALFVGLALAAGVLVARRRGRLTPVGAALVALLMVAVVPVLAINGLFPFHAAWPAGCAQSPAPNAEVFYAVLAAPLVAALAAFVSARAGRRA